ncbi:ATPase [Aspergillus homomorphus CBS 101889]|uniref:ATPase n=1 Tax=Aspergillus homomorphus (strain CBS 101889) TaxID=1450537 RepID=A0A395IE06_ASPHC|nr:ATPase [Aspergillus homomorphus CBS 101889]RAL17393.1 ATPase [Aspergillus homomorphus CBS 101889]
MTTVETLTADVGSVRTTAMEPDALPPESETEIPPESQPENEKDRRVEGEDESSKAPKSQLDTIPRATVEEWFKTSKSSLSRFEELESRTQRVVDAHGFDWQDALQDISSSLFEEMQMLRDLNEPQEIDISVAKIRYLPWGEAATLDCPPAKHFAIEIPHNEPSAGDIRASTGGSGQSVALLTGEEDTDSLPLTTLPERIRINSHRLKHLLDYEFGNGDLSYHGGTPLSILRPFKLLVYFDKPIRAKLAEFEAARKEIQDLSEEEYIQALVDSSVEDKGYSKDDWPSMSVLELTALIMDCRCLTQFMDETLRPAQMYLATAPEMVRFSDLWFLFAQGSLVYIKGSNPPQKIWKVVQRTGGRRILEGSGHPRDKTLGTWTTFVLDCFYLDYDGTRFIPVFRQFEISGFDGTQAVKSLPVLPLPVAEREGLTDRAYLATRGKQFVECTQQILHLDYSGRCHYLDPSGRKLTDMVDKIPSSASCYSEQIDSDVIVDFARALGEIPWWRPVTNDHTFGETLTAETGTDTGIERDAVWDKRFTDDFMEAQTLMWDAWAKTGGGPTDDDLLILPDRVFAFVLSTRRWACLQIGRDPSGNERLRKRPAKENPWLKLRLPDGHKDLVQSLIHSHFNRNKSGSVHFDLLRNKGNGVTILLHGVPGVGKTSTAECAAISNGRPLLPITCGDLGLTAGEVEEKLKEIFRLAQDWGCIMLLDEADVFLAQRRAYDVERNALVSVFLRTLEYYEGILFLTTNRVGVFDEAFKSRIHMSLYYPPLNWPQTYEIWSGHIDEANKAGIIASKGELTSFANQIFYAQCRPGSGPVWNGRQIRNAFQSALALAAFHTNEGAKIQLHATYFHNVFTVSDNFSRYIWITQKKQDDAERNSSSMVRRDDFTYDTTGVLNLQPPQQPTVMQPSYTQGGMPASSLSQGHPSSQQMGAVGSGQPYMGDPRNLQAGNQNISLPMGPQSGQQLQQPSPQLALHPQLNLSSNNLNDNYNLHSSGQSLQQPSPQIIPQPQVNMLSNNNANENYAMQQQQQQQHAQFISLSEAVASQNQNTGSQSALPPPGQHFNHQPSTNFPR